MENQQFIRNFAIIARYVNSCYTQLMREKIEISVEELRKLYEIEHLSTYKIGLILGCNRQTITNKLITANITRRSIAQARVQYKMRKNFDGSLEEKAYIIGFRLGDLHVYKPGRFSETIVARCHTTNMTQVRLLENLFANYGRVTISRGVHGYNVNCLLNDSFSFLLPKHDFIENWITRYRHTFCAFIAGYIDAEGCFQINQNKGRFLLASCDKDILNSIYTFLCNSDINCKYSKISKKGTKSIGTYCFSNDVWRISVNDRLSLYRLIWLIKPYIKHEKRLSDIQKVQLNLEIRMT